MPEIAWETTITLILIDEFKYECLCDAFAIFDMDENGRAQRIKMKGISPNMDFSFDFQDLDLKQLK